MTKTKLKAEYKEEIINIVFSEGKVVKIDISGDVDLTELIKELIVLIKDEAELDLQKFDSEDPKLLLIQNTIEEIINSFNKSVNIVEESDCDDDIPF